MTKNAAVSDELWGRIGRRQALAQPVREEKGQLQVSRAPGDSDAMHLARELEHDLQRRRAAMLSSWDHANYLGTPGTYANAAKINQGALARLFLSGEISRDELAWAVEIAMVAEDIERDVDPGIMSYEPRIDDSKYGKIKASLVEGIIRVRREVAYTYWRSSIPQPKRAILDMILGEPKPYSTVAREYRIGHRRAKLLLLTALNLWPSAMDRADEEVDAATIAAAHAAIL